MNRNQTLGLVALLVAGAGVAYYYVTGSDPATTDVEPPAQQAPETTPAPSAPAPATTPQPPAAVLPAPPVTPATPVPDCTQYSLQGGIWVCTGIDG